MNPDSQLPDMRSALMKCNTICALLAEHLESDGYRGELPIYRALDTLEELTADFLSTDNIPNLPPRFFDSYLQLWAHIFNNYSYFETKGIREICELIMRIISKYDSKLSEVLSTLVKPNSKSEEKPLIYSHELSHPESSLTIISAAHRLTWLSMQFVYLYTSRQSPLEANHRLTRDEKYREIENTIRYAQGTLHLLESLLRSIDSTYPVAYLAEIDTAKADEYPNRFSMVDILLNNPFFDLLACESAARRIECLAIFLPYTNGDQTEKHQIIYDSYLQVLKHYKKITSRILQAEPRGQYYHLLAYSYIWQTICYMGMATSESPADSFQKQQYLLEAKGCVEEARRHLFSLSAEIYAPEINPIIWHILQSSFAKLPELRKRIDEWGISGGTPVPA